MASLTDPCSWRGDSKLALSAYALLLLRKGRVGRKGLAELLDVGEATGRTILSKLKSTGLAGSDRGGAYLTAKGSAEADSLAGVLEPADVELPERYGGEVACVIVKNGCSVLGTGVMHRDEAVRGGADGALIMVKRGGKYMFPDWSYEYPVKVNPEPPDGACVVIAWAGSRSLAINGVMRAASSILCASKNYNYPATA
ncbi:MAG: DUF4443 domain-containing protein [Conexivisphaera sp.]